MIERQITIINKLGLHARAATRLAKAAARFEADIRISAGQSTVDVKSVMSLMLLAAAKGTLLTITAEGSDEDAAMEAIANLIDNRFDEEE